MTRPKDEMGSQIVFFEFDIFHPILVYLSRSNNTQAQGRRFPALRAPEPEFPVTFGSKWDPLTSAWRQGGASPERLAELPTGVSPLQKRIWKWDFYHCSSCNFFFHICFCHLWCELQSKSPGISREAVEGSNSVTAMQIKSPERWMFFDWLQYHSKVTTGYYTSMLKVIPLRRCFSARLHIWRKSWYLHVNLFLFFTPSVSLWSGWLCSWPVFIYKAVITHCHGVSGIASSNVAVSAKVVGYQMRRLAQDAAAGVESLCKE